MTDETIDLDQHRGTAAQKATDLRRLLANVTADQNAFRRRRDELESRPLAAPAANCREATEKARYLLNLFAAALSCVSTQIPQLTGFAPRPEGSVVAARSLWCRPESRRKLP
jgi:hypothetical protein